MNFLQRALLGALLSQEETPRIVDSSTATYTVLPGTFDLPRRRESGILLLVFIFGNTDAGYALPSGWTSLALTTTNNTMRIAYRFCDGSEASTISIAQISGGNNTGVICLSIANAVSNRPPVISANVSGTVISTIDPAVVTMTVPFGSPLFISFVATGVVTVTQYPIGFSTRNLFSVAPTNFVGYLVAENIGLGAMDPGAWTFSATGTLSTFTIGIPGQ